MSALSNGKPHLPQNRFFPNGRGREKESIEDLCMKLPHFNPDQLCLILAIGLLAVGLTVWRYYSIF